ncbi:MAG: hypothetical protein JSV65_03170 [Armatimonadota bacterium]|nr:MAG: hypothetical protein JSV65_03170 [Armatimonadota bacterium]
MKRPLQVTPDDLPPALEPKRRRAEKALGMPVRVRGVRTRHKSFRGRTVLRQGCVIVEYQVAAAGYFWHVPIIEEILDRLAAGETEIHLERGEPPR